MKISKNKVKIHSAKVIKPNFFESYNLLATFFGVGNSRYAPGTLGSLMGIVIWVAFNYTFLYFNIQTPLIYIFWVIFLILLYFAGAEAAQLYSKKTKSEDSSSIIIDEIVGQLMVLLLSYYFVADNIIYDGLTNFFSLINYLILSFMLFRIFDINKPSIIGMADKKIKSGHGVMMDDVLAGLISATIIILSIAILSNNF